MTGKSVRVRLIATIHASAKELGLDEDTRRDLMERETGKRSASAMNEGELAKVVGALSARKPAGPRKGFTPHEDPQVRKIYAQWTALRRDGKVTAAKPHAFAKRQTGVDRVEWATPEQLRLVIEALKALQTRTSKGGGVDPTGRSK